MKKLVLMFLILVSHQSFGATGWFSDYIIISVNGGGSNYYWIGGNPGFGTQFHGLNFGSDILSLTITGADMKYWSDTQDRTGGAFYWMIKSADGNTIITEASENIWTQSGIGGNDYQGLLSSLNINVLSGLSANTTYQFHVYAKHWGTGQGDNWLNNSTANYVATFTTDSELPVQLSSFSANIISKSVNLTWQTATEVNNYGFDVERKMLNRFAHGEQHDNSWEKIGFVAGNGNSNSPKEYSFADNSLNNSGKYSYRLKQVDNDGSYEYSSVVEVDYNPVITFELAQNYPNPFNPSTSISYSIPNAEFVNIKVFNLLGEEVATLFNGYMEAGKHTLSFDASKLNSGMYLYKITAGNLTQVKKMLLAK
jgi:hypothetical protein